MCDYSPTLTTTSTFTLPTQLHTQLTALSIYTLYWQRILSGGINFTYHPLIASIKDNIPRMSSEPPLDNSDARSEDSLSDYGGEDASFTDSPTTGATPKSSRALKSPRNTPQLNSSLPSAISAATATSPPPQAKSTPPLRPQRSVRKFPNGSRSPPMSITPGTGRSPRRDNVDLPMPESAPSIAAAAMSAIAAASATTSPPRPIPSSTSAEGLGISSLDDPDPALVAKAEAEAIAQAEAESRPRTLSGVRALAKERARLRKEAALAAVNASTGIAPAASSPEHEDPNDEQGGGGNKVRRRQASRQDTAMRDALQVSLDPSKQPVLAKTSASSDETSSRGHESSNPIDRRISTDDASSRQAKRPSMDEPSSTAVRRQVVESPSGTAPAGEFAELDAALSAALDDLSFSSVGSTGTIRATATAPPLHLVGQQPAPSAAPAQDPHPSAHQQQSQQQASKAATTAPAVHDLVFPDQGAAPPTAFAPSAVASQQTIQAPTAAAPLPSAALLASRERPPKAHGPIPQHAFIPPLPTSASQPQQAAVSPTIPSAPFSSSSSAAASAPFVPQRRNTLPPPTDISGHLLIYGKSIPFPEPYLNSNVPGMNAPERRRILLGNTNFNPMSISAPHSGLIHPTVERAKAYAAKANALFAIETGLEVWVRAMGATRPGARNVYSMGATSSSSSSSSRRASAGAGLMLAGAGAGAGAGAAAGGPVSAAAAAFKQSMAGMNSGPPSRQLASGRTQSISAAAGLGGNVYGQFGGSTQSTSSGLPGATHPKRHEEASMASVRSDMTFPMRGDGGRAKDITSPSAPAHGHGHGQHMASSDSADSRLGYLSGGGDLPPQPESPPNAPPRNLPYPGVLSYGGRNNSVLSAVSSGSGGTEIPPRGSSIDIPYALARSTDFGGPIPPVPALPPTSLPMRNMGSSSSKGSNADSTSIPALSNRRESMRTGAGPGPLELKLGPTTNFEPLLSHGPRMPRSATSATTAPGTRPKGASVSDGSTAVFPSSSGASTPRDTRAPTLSGTSGGNGAGAGWADLRMQQDVATPGSAYMSAVSHTSSGFGGALGNGGGVSVSSSSPVPLSNHNGAGGRQTKVLGPRAPKLSLSGAQAFEAATTAAAANGGDVGKRMSVSVGNSNHATTTQATDRFGLLAGFSLGSPQDFNPSPSPRDLSPGASSPSVNSLPGAAPPPPLLVGAGGKNSPQLLQSPQSATSRRPSAATGFIPVGVSTKIRKASFGGGAKEKKEVSHSRDFFFSDLGRNAGTLGDAEGFGEEEVVVVEPGSSPLVGGAGVAGNGGGIGIGIGGSLLSPPGTPGMVYSSSPNSGRSRTLSRSGSNVEIRSGGSSGLGSGGLGQSVDTLPGAGSSHGLPRSPSLADTSSSYRGGGVSSSSLSYGSVRANSGSGASVGGGGGGTSSSSNKKLSKKMQFEETLAKMQDVIPDADRDVLARYLEKANGNDLGAMHHYFADQAKGKIQSAKSPRRNGY
ncbi:hypothetical protein A4X13_0g6424 [Tilletia indica]|uniref:Uncharacterized protein n=1 Tax=Tilletia indica TaxID=43049 RepID=A0A177TCP4_9BASI|nr:hypothetical protein A4X13_0g6424 [Tilletia indica]